MASMAPFRFLLSEVERSVGMGVIGGQSGSRGTGSWMVPS